MNRPPKVWAVVVGGGSGRRFGRAKQYELVGGERVIDRSRRVAESVCDGVILVVPAADVAAERGVAGGATRAESVRAGLAAVPDDADIVCVHDAARPFATPEIYRRVIDAVLAGSDGAVPGVPVADTIKVIDDRSVVTATPERSTLIAAQTPQAFRATMLRAAHTDGAEGTDDASLVERHGGSVVAVDGDPMNRKITHADDLVWARRVIEELAGGTGPDSDTSEGEPE